MRSHEKGSDFLVNKQEEVWIKVKVGCYACMQTQIKIDMVSLGKNDKKQVLEYDIKVQVEGDHFSSTWYNTISH